jgi:hypothetical protein
MGCKLGRTHKGPLHSFVQITFCVAKGLLNKNIRIGI